MKIIKTVKTLNKYLELEKAKGHTIGFTPTMGALHDGHLSLVRHSSFENDISVVSVFVNPTQFNQKEDLVKYPRDLEGDASLIKKECDYLFAPSVNQVYPKGLDTSVDLDVDHLSFSMEGPNRPGHFDGVVQVVHRFLDIIKPDAIYMGQKDFQQFSIVGYMIRTLDMPVQLRVCPTLREKDGLAMSSRNLRLKKKDRKRAHIIYDTLNYAKDKLGKLKPGTIESRAMQNMNIPEFRPEYFEIVDGYTMKKVTEPDKHDVIVACTAVWAGKVRLIDNMILKGAAHLNMVE